MPLTLKTSWPGSQHLPQRSMGLRYHPLSGVLWSAFMTMSIYLLLPYQISWSGNPATCNAGSTSQAYIDASFDLINYYRAMVELPPVVNDTSKNASSQEAALMMSVNDSLSHSPPDNWECFSPEGDAAAGSSNLAIGAAGPDAIKLYIWDFGSSNTAVGHRRWILSPTRSSFGIGSVGGGTRDANALWVFAGTTSRPPTDIVAWPPRGVCSLSAGVSTLVLLPQ